MKRLLVILVMLAMSDIGHAFDWPHALREGSDTTVGVRVRDLSGASTVAHLVNATVANEATGAILWGPTNIVPTSKNVTIQLPPAALEVQDNTLTEEWHRLTLIALVPDGCTPGSTCEAVTEEVRLRIWNFNLAVDGLPTPGATP